MAPLRVTSGPRTRRRRAGRARALDLRDHETAGHGRQVADLAQRLGGRHGMVGAELDALRPGALLHDVGEIGVRDAGRVSAAPLGRSRPSCGSIPSHPIPSHPIRDHDLLADVAQLQAAAAVVRSHLLDLLEHADDAAPTARVPAAVAAAFRAGSATLP